MKIAGYLLIGGILLVFGDFMPKTAVATTSLILIGTVLTSPNELQNAANFIRGATK